MVPMLSAHVVARRLRPSDPPWTTRSPAQSQKADRLAALLLTGHDEFVQDIVGDRIRAYGHHTQSFTNCFHSNVKRPRLQWRAASLPYVVSLSAQHGYVLQFMPHHLNVATSSAQMFHGSSGRCRPSKGQSCPATQAQKLDGSVAADLLGRATPAAALSASSFTLGELNPARQAAAATSER